MKICITTVVVVTKDDADAVGATDHLFDTAMKAWNKPEGVIFYTSKLVGLEEAPGFSPQEAAQRVLELLNDRAQHGC